MPYPYEGSKMQSIVDLSILWDCTKAVPSAFRLIYLLTALHEMREPRNPLGNEALHASDTYVICSRNRLIGYKLMVPNFEKFMDWKWNWINAHNC